MFMNMKGIESLFHNIALNFNQCCLNEISMSLILILIRYFLIQEYIEYIIFSHIIKILLMHQNL